MSEQPAAPPARPRSGGGNVFTNKIGPLPMWAWVGIAAAILIIWRMFAAKQSASAAASTAATDSTAANTVPQFVNQVYTSVTPPTAEGPEPNGHDGEDHDGDKGKIP